MKSLKSPDTTRPAASPVPLPFNPAKLRGISEKLIVSHHDHNYSGAVKNLNAVRAELAALPADTPAYRIGGLRAHELTYGNSVTLHEHYFANLGGNGKADGAVVQAIAAAWGGFAQWESGFRAAAGSLGGGSGWVVLDLHLPTGELRVGSAADHAQAVAAGLPLLVLDMYEHAYQMDYGAAADHYIAAFFDNVNWDEVNHRYERARNTLAAYAGSTRVNGSAFVSVSPAPACGDDAPAAGSRVPVMAGAADPASAHGKNGSPAKNPAA